MSVFTAAAALTAQSGSEASFTHSRYSILYARFKTFKISRVFDIKTGVAEQQSKTRENLNVLNLAYQMEYLLRENVASEPDMPVTPVEERFPSLHL